MHGRHRPPPAPGPAFQEHAMTTLHEDLVRFFSPDRWQSPLGEFEHSGYALVDEVRALAPRFVVDVGCGYNLFKHKIPNLIGIDLANPAADLICDLLDAPIRPASIDVVLALGSINYGDQALIERQLACVAGWLAPGGRMIMRANPGMATGPGLAFFPWSAEAVDPIGRAVGLHRDGPIRYDTYRNRRGVDEPRLVWHYRPAGCPRGRGAPGDGMVAGAPRRHPVAGDPG